MTFTLAGHDFRECVRETAENSQDSHSLGGLDMIWRFPTRFGEGYWREIQLREELHLMISDYQLHETLIQNYTDCAAHPLEFSFFLSGDYNLSLNHGNHYGSTADQHMLCGSGLIPASFLAHSEKQRIRVVSVQLTSQLFKSFFGNASEPVPSELNHLVRHPEQEFFIRFGKTTAAMQQALQQILHCPYDKLTKLMALESNVLDLMSLVIEQSVEEMPPDKQSCVLWADDIERLHYAKTLLSQNLDNPPTLSALAHQVGLNGRKLKQGFRQVFGTTAFGYLHECRLEKARQLLEQNQMTVAGVAQAVGFANRGYFAAAFKQKFGMNPRDYLAAGRTKKFL